jgi:hypothetical protein
MAGCAAILYFASPGVWLALLLWLLFTASFLYYLIVGHALFGPHLFLVGFVDLARMLFTSKRD